MAMDTATLTAMVAMQDREHIQSLRRDPSPMIPVLDLHAGIDHLHILCLQ